MVLQTWIGSLHSVLAWKDIEQVMYWDPWRVGVDDGSQLYPWANRPVGLAAGIIGPVDDPFGGYELIKMRKARRMGWRFCASLSTLSCCLLVGVLSRSDLRLAALSLSPAGASCWEIFRYQGSVG